MAIKPCPSHIRRKRAKLSMISPYGLSDRWFYGDCRFFAEELKRLLGREAKLVAIEDFLHFRGWSGYAHVFVLYDRFLYDASGKRTKKEVLAKWSEKWTGKKLRLVKHDGRKWRPVYSGSIVDAAPIEKVRRLARRDARKLLELMNTSKA